jgi:hypothetical protein
MEKRRIERIGEIERRVLGMETIRSKSIHPSIAKPSEIYVK